MLRAFLFLLILFLADDALAASPKQHSCQQGNVIFTTDFASARLDQCKKLSDNEFHITLQPENIPINDSPWYAFKVVGKSAQSITIRMTVEHGKHRYLPKFSTDKKHWQLLEHKIKDKVMTIVLPISEQPIWIAGQEIIDNDDYYQWGELLAKKKLASHSILGWSTQDRPIFKLETNNNQKELIVILGRMHPPELTGAMALFPFVETLLSKSSLAQKFAQNYDILVVPNINPDGVFHGNWRHNANGLDLNRQWNKFTEKEVIAIDKYLEQLVEQGKKIAFAVDFHSTHRPIFYTMPTDYGVQEKYLVNNWLTDLDNHYPNFKVIQKPGNNPSLGVFKQYIADKFDVHAITYEMGDNTDRQFIDKLAEDAATTLMQTLLKGNNSKNHHAH